MSNTPFRDAAKRIARDSQGDYVRMQVDSDRARSHAWWRNLVEYGAWAGPGGRVGPPTPETLSGIAKLFGTSEEQVAAMIAADWYGVYPDTDISPRVLKLGPTLDRLAETDLELVEALSDRLAPPPKVLKRLPNR